MRAVVRAMEEVVSGGRSSLVPSRNYDNVIDGIDSRLYNQDDAKIMNEKCWQCMENRSSKVVYANVGY